MNTKRKTAHAAGAERDTNGNAGSSSCAVPCSWLDQAGEFARREPVKAVACAFSAGLLLHLLPTRATTTVVLSLARPVLLCLGMLKVWELSSCNAISKV